MAKSLPTRTEVEKSLTWDLTDMFSSDMEWETLFTATQKDIGAFPVYAETLSKSAEALFAALESENKLSLSLERLYVYAHMHQDEDNALPLYQGMTDRAMQLAASFSAAASFMAPEILSMDEDVLKSMIAHPLLNPYRRVLDNLLRGRLHTLSKEEERLLALASEPLSAADTIFSMLNNADIRFGLITGEDGDEVELTQGNYRGFVESKNQAVRKSAYMALYSSYIALKNTLAASYSSSVKANVFYARARNHPSAIQAALFSSDVSLDVYNELINAVESKLPVLQRYLSLRKRVLNLDALHMYDLYVPIVEQPKRHMEYQKAQALVLEALAPLGNDYAAMLRTAYNDRWIDVCENRGKTTGAYSWGAYGTHPYVLLNYQDEEDYAFTLAHELGHAMHTYYSDKALPYQDAQYKIMAAEVASTVNEVLLIRYLLANEEDSGRRAYLLNHFLEQFRTTVFRQTMFAAFEKETHEISERGEPLTHKALCTLYGALNEKYYPGVIIDEQIRMEWSRIPHFYNAFYVYQYATGFCAAVKLARDILNGVGLSKYLDFLSSGGKDFPIKLLQAAGVDLEKPQSILAALDEFEACVAELDALL